jgi:hypothetical protein
MPGRTLRPLKQPPSFAIGLPPGHRLDLDLAPPAAIAGPVGRRSALAHHSPLRVCRDWQARFPSRASTTRQLRHGWPEMTKGQPFFARRRRHLGSGAASRRVWQLRPSAQHDRSQSSCRILSPIKRGLSLFQLMHSGKGQTGGPTHQRLQVGGTRARPWAASALAS